MRSSRVGATGYEPTTPWKNTWSESIFPKVLDRLGFPSVDRESGSSLGASVAGWWRFVASDFDGYLVGRAHDLNQNQPLT